MEQEVGAGGKCPAGDPPRLVVERRGQVRLVVGQVDEHLSLLFDPVADRRPAMLHRLRLDERAPDPPRLPGHVLEDGPRRSLREADREERRRQVPRDSRSSTNWNGCPDTNPITINGTFYGYAELEGGSGVDKIHGGPGADRLDGGHVNGGNYLVGYDGTDFCSFGPGSGPGPANGDYLDLTCEFPLPGVDRVDLSKIWPKWDWKTP